MVLRAASILLLTTALSAAIVLSHSSTADASCGDWLDLHSQMDAASQLDSSTKKVHLPRHAEKWKSSSADRPTPGPCNGPNCRRAPLPLAPAIPLDWKWSSEKTLFVESIDASASSDEKVHASHGSRVHALRGHAPRLDHPPRVS
jgi:hypothetical protein